MSRESCIECKFFRASGNAAGECRRRAPDKADPSRMPFQWPLVKDVNWCGEFVAIPVEPRHKPKVTG